LLLDRSAWNSGRKRQSMCSIEFNSRILAIFPKNVFYRKTVILGSFWRVSVWNVWQSCRSEFLPSTRGRDSGVPFPSQLLVRSTVSPVEAPKDTEVSATHVTDRNGNRRTRDRNSFNLRKLLKGHGLCPTIEMWCWTKIIERYRSMAWQLTSVARLYRFSSLTCCRFVDFLYKKLWCSVIFCRLDVQRSICCRSVL